MAGHATGHAWFDAFAFSSYASAVEAFYHDRSVPTAFRLSDREALTAFGFRSSKI